MEEHMTREGRLDWHEWVFVYSLVLPGYGHWYCGERRRGAILMALFCLLLVVFCAACLYCSLEFSAAVASLASATDRLEGGEVAAGVFGSMARLLENSTSASVCFWSFLALLVGWYWAAYDSLASAVRRRPFEPGPWDVGLMGWICPGAAQLCVRRLPQAALFFWSWAAMTALSYIVEWLDLPVTLSSLAGVFSSISASGTAQGGLAAVRHVAGGTLLLLLSFAASLCASVSLLQGFECWVEGGGELFPSGGSTFSLASRLAGLGWLCPGAVVLHHSAASARWYFGAYWGCVLLETIFPSIAGCGVSPSTVVMLAAVVDALLHLRSGGS